MNSGFVQENFRQTRGHHTGDDNRTSPGLSQLAKGALFRDLIFKKSSPQSFKVFGLKAFGMIGMLKPSQVAPAHVQKYKLGAAGLRRTKTKAQIVASIEVRKQEDPTHTKTQNGTPKDRLPSPEPKSPFSKLLSQVSHVNATYQLFTKRSIAPRRSK